jgi:inorganic pyrophosphatase/exopolyphosphatase
MEQYAHEVEDIAASLKQRARETAGAKDAAGHREHPTAYVENLVASVSVPPGCLFVGHINTDMDSVGGAVAAAQLYDGVATLAEPVQKLNGEIMYACKYARTGEKPAWSAKDISAWKAQHGDTLRGFGTGGHSLRYFGDVFVDASDDAAAPPPSSVVMVDHNAPSQMVACLKKCLVDDGKTDVLKGIIDHHALDEKISTKGPLFMDVRPWGSMCTILVHSFLRSAKPIPVDVARMMLCAIMSDTVNLTSPTTTLADRYIVPLLTRFCDEPDHNKLAQGLFRAKTAWFAALSPFECVRADQKDFESIAADGTVRRWGWATVEVNEPDKLMCQANHMLLELVNLKNDKGLAFAFLSVVDLDSKTSMLLLCGAAEVSLARTAFSDGVVFNACDRDTGEDAESARGMVVALGIAVGTSGMDIGARTSRKKQFKPAVDQALGSGWTEPERAAETAETAEAAETTAAAAAAVETAVASVTTTKSRQKSSRRRRMTLRTRSFVSVEQVLKREYVLEEEPYGLF